MILFPDHLLLALSFVDTLHFIRQTLVFLMFMIIGASSLAVPQNPELRNNLEYFHLKMFKIISEFKI